MQLKCINSWNCCRKINLFYKLASEVNEEQDESILAEHGIKVLKLLGKGTQAYVYDCLYDGKRVVAKIANNNHASAVAPIEQVKKKMPQSVQKHFAHVYDVIKIENGPKDKQYIILTEYLKPINIHLRQLFFNDLSDNHDLVSNILLDKLTDESKFNKAADVYLLSEKEDIERYISYSEFKHELYSIYLPF